MPKHINALEVAKKYAEKAVMDARWAGLVDDMDAALEAYNAICQALHVAYKTHYGEEEAA